MYMHFQNDKRVKASCERNRLAFLFANVVRFSQTGLKAASFHFLLSVPGEIMTMELAPVLLY